MSLIRPITPNAHACCHNATRRADTTCKSPCRTSQLHAIFHRTWNPAPRTPLLSTHSLTLHCQTRLSSPSADRKGKFHARACPSIIHPAQTPTPHLLNSLCSSNSRSRRIRSSSWNTCRWTRRRRSSLRGGARSRLRCCWPWEVLDWGLGWGRKQVKGVPDVVIVVTVIP